MAFEVLPASWDELYAVQHLLADLPEHSQVVADKGYICDRDWGLAYYYGDVTIHTEYRNNRREPNLLEKMGVQRLHARTLEGFYLKVMASLSALAFTNWID